MNFTITHTVWIEIPIHTEVVEADNATDAKQLASSLTEKDVLTFFEHNGLRMPKGSSFQSRTGEFVMKHVKPMP